MKTEIMGSFVSGAGALMKLTFLRVYMGVVIDGCAELLMFARVKCKI